MRDAIGFEKLQNFRYLYAPKRRCTHDFTAIYEERIPSVDKDTHGFDGQKNAHATSKPLPIHKVLPAGFSLPERISAPAKLLRT